LRLGYTDQDERVQIAGVQSPVLAAVERRLTIKASANLCVPFLRVLRELGGLRLY
jgi:hypothetical protein